MKLKILGNNGPYPASGGACSGYLLTSDNTRVLIECGTGTLANLRKIQTPDRLDAVILSHLHYDHMSDILPMVYALQFCPPRPKLPVYAPDAPQAVRNLLNAPFYQPMDIQDVQIGDISVRFYPVRHPVKSFAMRFECAGRVFAYTGDTNVVDGLADFCRDADLLLADAGLSSADWKMEAPHLSAKACGELAHESRAKRLLLTHLNPKYDPDELCAEAKTVFENTAFTAIGESYTV